MRNPVEIENIEEMRRTEGIDDVELREEVRRLRVGDTVHLTLLTGAKSPGGETVLARITHRRGYAFRGKLTSRPVHPRLASLEIGTPFSFTTTHIHSIPREQPAPEGRPRRRAKKAAAAEEISGCR